MASILNLMSKVELIHVALSLLRLPQLENECLVGFGELLVEGQSIVVVPHQQNFVVSPACSIDHGVV